jgi:hypothetical protein
LEASQAIGLVVHELHGISKEPMTGLIADEPMHLLTDPSVALVAAFSGAEFQQMEGLASIHLHVEADAIGKGYCVLGDL